MIYVVILNQLACLIEQNNFVANYCGPLNFYGGSLVPGGKRPCVFFISLIFLLNTNTCPLSRNGGASVKVVDWLKMLYYPTSFHPACFLLAWMFLRLSFPTEHSALPSSPLQLIGQALGTFHHWNWLIPRSCKYLQLMIHRLLGSQALKPAFTNIMGSLDIKWAGVASKCV